MFIEKKDLPADIAILTRKDRQAGLVHAKTIFLSNPWLFDDTGRYAVTVNSKVSMTHEMEVPALKLSIIVYDCLVREAFEYLTELSNISFDWFYWFEEYIVLVDLANFKSNVYCFMMDHKKRNARLTHVRSVLLANGVNVLKIYPLSTHGIVGLENKEYFPLCCEPEQELLLLPKDPFGEYLPKLFIINCPLTGHIGVVNGIRGEYSLYPCPMAYNSSVYFYKVMKFIDHYLFRQDCLIEIDLSNLVDVYGKKTDYEQVKAKQDGAAYSEVRLEIDNVPDGELVYYLGHVKFGSRLNSNYNGFHHVMYFQPIPGYTYADCFIDLKNKKLVQFARIKWDFSEMCECFHPSGQFLRIYFGYGNELKCEMLTNTNKYMLTMKEIAKQRLYFGKKIQKQDDYLDIVDTFL